MATTTVAPRTYVAKSPQPTDYGAAEILVAAWAGGDRAAAAAVATPAAVSELFAARYPGNYLQGRGCTSGVNPGTCTYSNRAVDNLIEIEVRRIAAGWYVTRVTIES